MALLNASQGAGCDGARIDQGYGLKIFTGIEQTGLVKYSANVLPINRF